MYMYVLEHGVDDDSPQKVNNFFNNQPDESTSFIYASIQWFSAWDETLTIEQVKLQNRIDQGNMDRVLVKNYN